MDDAGRARGDLTQGSLLPRLIRFGIPLVLGMFFHSLFNLVDLLIVGPLDRGTPYEGAALGAVNVASIINFIPMLLMTGVNNASIAFISRNFGLRNYKRANAYNLQSFILLAVLAVVLGVPSYLWARELNQLAGAKAEALAGATEYLEISSLGLFTMFGLMQVTAVLRAGGNAKWPMILLIGANVLNAIGTLFLVHGLWIFPKLGVAGAAWATVGARGLFMLLGMWIITRPSAPVRLDLRRIRFRWRMLWRLTSIGIPSSLQFVVRTLAYLAILKFVTAWAATPAEAIAVHAALAVGIRLDMLALFTGAGWGAAAAAMVGQCLGAQQPDRAHKAGLWATALDAALMSAFGIIFFGLAPVLLVLFGLTEGRLSVSLGVEYVRIVVYAYPFVAVGVTLAQGLNGSGSTKMPLLLDTVGFLAVQVPVAAFIAGNADRWDRTALWWSLVATNALVAGLYYLVWRHGSWKKKELR